MLSILHRATGVFLAMGTIVLVYWLWTVAQGPVAYSAMQSCLSHWFAQLVLLGWTFSLFYHLCNGIRHLFWDVGRGYEIDTLYTTGKIVMVVAALLTAVTWALATGLISLGGGA
jgi:succinate dehydrogenase / fumarate reductase cytochrome b subunit